MRSLADFRLSREIRYRGLLTYRGLRLFALIAMTIAHVCSLLLMNDKLSVLLDLPTCTDFQVTLLQIGSALGQMTFPLLLIASFGIILEGSGSVKRMLITYFLIAVITYLAVVFFIADKLNFVLDRIPSVLSMIISDGQLISSNEWSTLNNIYFRIFLKVIPGDGTIHLEYINAVLEAFGLSFRVPTLEALELKCSGFMSHETFTMIMDTVSRITPENFQSAIGELWASLVTYLPFDPIFLITNTFLPRLAAILTAKLNFNVFWDLFLYTAFYVFTCSHPKKLKGGPLLLYRCCAVFPAGWLLLSAMITGNMRATQAQLPIPLVAAMSTRNISALAVFFLMVLFQKYREAEFALKDPTGEEWNSFKKTNICSFQFSVFAGMMLCIVSLIDLLLRNIPTLTQWGIGRSTYMWTGFPVLLLYAYNRKPKHKALDIIIPVYYVAYYILIFLFGLSLLADIYVSFSPAA